MNNISKQITTSPLTLLLILVGFAFSTNVALAEGTSSDASATSDAAALQVTSHADILRINAKQPKSVIMVYDDLVKKFGDIWEGSYAPSHGEHIQLAALRDANSWFEMAWPKATTVVGVQFTGDYNDGLAIMLVDGQEAWRGNIRESSYYVEVSGLNYGTHTVRVESLGQGHVTVTAFGAGAVFPESNGFPVTAGSLVNSDQDENQIFMPYVPGS